MVYIYTVVYPFYLALAVMLTLYFPIHLILFVTRKRQAWKEKRSAGPSFLTLLFYFLLLYSFLQLFFMENKFCRISKQSEAKTNLGSIFTTQVAYYGEYSTYAGGPKAFDLLKWAPEGESRYAYLCGVDAIPHDRAKALGLEPSGNWPFKVRPQTAPEAFTCLAIGNIDYDQVLDVWTISDNKELRNLLNDVGYATQEDLAEFYINPPKLTLLERAVMGFWLIKYEFDYRFRIGFAVIALLGPYLLIWLLWQEGRR